MMGARNRLSGRKKQRRRRSRVGDRRRRPATASNRRSAVVAQIRLGLADLPLRLAFQVLFLAPKLFAGVARQAAHRVPDFAFGLLACPFGLILEAITIEIVRHTSPWCET